jgi:hypothetical protein
MEKNLINKFEKLKAQWEKDTSHHSSMSIICNHPAYQEIIKMGDAIVPILLADLKKAPQHWFWALCVITGANPVPLEDRGKIKKMVNHWLKWGEEHGYDF